MCEPVTEGPMSQMPNEAEEYLLASTFTKRLAMHLNGVQPAELMGDLDGQRAILKDFGGHIWFWGTIDWRAVAAESLIFLMVLNDS